MSETIDPNKIVADLIKNSFNTVIKGLKKITKDSYRKIFEDFDRFMQICYRKNNFVRILSQRDSDIELYDIYVNTKFKLKTDVYTDEELIYHIREGKNVIINGNGGSGKTFFMRHLWLTFFKENINFIPIFIELRQLNSFSNIDLFEFIREAMSLNKEINRELFDYFCENGRFCFILDGYDEVSSSLRNELQEQILNYSNLFQDCRFVISSRYEQRFAGWQNFDILEALPFSRDQTLALLNKIPFDEETKKLFIESITDPFFKENKSFLSSPLLAIMMLMTFRDNMDIPKNMNIFYDQAFTTLYQWHDATKAFKREKILDINQFQRSFGTFCLLSYCDEKFDFTKSEVINYISKSNRICGISENPENILKDYEESVNLLKQDGLRYVFIHRSFQEYFTAYAIVRLFSGKFSEIIEKIKHRFQDKVISMCLEMNKNLVVEKYLKKLYSDLYDLVIIDNNERYYFLDLFNIELIILFNEDIKKYGHSIRSGTMVSDFVSYISILNDKENIIDKIMLFIFKHKYTRDFVKELSILLKGNKIDSCKLTFLKNDINVSLYDQDRNKLLDGREHEIKELLCLYADKLDLMNDFIKKEVDQLLKWCVKEIHECKVQAENLEEVLQLN